MACGKRTRRRPGSLAKRLKCLITKSINPGANLFLQDISLLKSQMISSEYVIGKN